MPELPTVPQELSNICKADKQQGPQENKKRSHNANTKSRIITYAMEHTPFLEQMSGNAGSTKNKCLVMQQAQKTITVCNLYPDKCSLAISLQFSPFSINPPIFCICIYLSILTLQSRY
jgi:hypothetical protein